MSVYFAGKLDSFWLSLTLINILPNNPTPCHLLLINASLVDMCIPVPQISSKLASTNVLLLVSNRVTSRFLFCKNFCWIPGSHRHSATVIHFLLSKLFMSRTISLQSWESSAASMRSLAMSSSKNSAFLV